MSAAVSPLQSCHDKLIELFSEKLYLIGLAALAVAVIMVSVIQRALHLPPSWPGDSFSCPSSTSQKVDEAF